MNNEQKNTYVKQEITSALLRLLEMKKLDDISVRELTDQAGVGRVSFYRNFTDKENILKQESDRLLTQWGNAFEDNPNSDYESFFLSLFDFYKDNQAFYTILCNSGLSHIILQTILDTAKITPDMADIQAYLKSFWAYGIHGWIIEWINRGMKESGNELYELFDQIQK